MAANTTGLSSSMTNTFYFGFCPSSAFHHSFVSLCFLGNIKNTEPLDSKRQRVHTFWVTAFDCGKNRAQADAQVVVTVKPSCKPGWMGKHRFLCLAPLALWGRGCCLSHLVFCSFIKTCVGMNLCRMKTFIYIFFFTINLTYALVRNYFFILAGCGIVLCNFDFFFL